MAVGVMGPKETVVTLRNKRLAGGANQQMSASGVSAATRNAVSKIFGEAKAMYAPGGGYMKGLESQLERGSKKAVASGAQGLAASGLAGTSMLSGLGLKYEEDVATPARAEANTQRLSALSGLLQSEAGAMASLATRYSSSPGGGGYGGGGGDAPGFNTTSDKRPATAAQPQAAKLPKLSAFPSISGVAKKPNNYQGVFYGAADPSQKKKTAAKPASAKKPLSSFYGDFMSKSSSPSLAKQLDPYGTFMNF